MISFRQLLRSIIVLGILFAETAGNVILTSGIILIGGVRRAYVGAACLISGLHGMFFSFKRPIVDPSENTLIVVAFPVSWTRGVWHWSSPGQPQ